MLQSVATGQRRTLRIAFGRRDKSSSGPINAAVREAFDDRTPCKKAAPVRTAKATMNFHGRLEKPTADRIDPVQRNPKYLTARRRGTPPALGLCARCGPNTIDQAILV